MNDTDMECTRGRRRPPTREVMTRRIGENFCRGQLEGRGIKTFFGRTSGGGEYNGMWKDSMAHGYGVRVFGNGDRHEEGMYEKDERHGQGTYTWNNGDVYTGSFRHGKMCGSGTKVVGTNNNNDHQEIYMGEWWDDMAHGVGTTWFAIGDVHSGGYRNDRPHGQGTLEYENGDWWEGFWDRGNKHGPGYHRYQHQKQVELEIWCRGDRVYHQTLSSQQELDNLPSVEALRNGLVGEDGRILEVAATASSPSAAEDGTREHPVMSMIVNRYRWAWEPNYWGQRFRRRPQAALDNTPSVGRRTSPVAQADHGGGGGGGPQRHPEVEHHVEMMGGDGDEGLRDPRHPLPDQHADAASKNDMDDSDFSSESATVSRC